MISQSLLVPNMRNWVMQSKQQTSWLTDINCLLAPQKRSDPVLNELQGLRKR